MVAENSGRSKEQIIREQVQELQAVLTRELLGADSATQVQCNSSSQEPPGAEVNQAVSLLNSGHIEESLKDFEALLIRYPQAVRLNFGKAVALGRLGRKKEASACLQLLLARDPSNTKAAILLEELQTVSESAASPSQVALLIDQALRWLRQNQPQQAITTLQILEDRQVAAQDLFYIKALAYFALGDLVSCRKYLEWELKRFANNQAAQNFLDNL